MSGQNDAVARGKAKYEKARDEKSAFERHKEKQWIGSMQQRQSAERSPVEFMARSKAKISKKRRLRN